MEFFKPFNLKLWDMAFCLVNHMGSMYLGLSNSFKAKTNWNWLSLSQNTPNALNPNWSLILFFIFSLRVRRVWFSRHGGCIFVGNVVGAHFYFKERGGNLIARITCPCGRPYLILISFNNWRGIKLLPLASSPENALEWVSSNRI